MVIFLDITVVLSGFVLGLTRGALRTTGKVRLAYGPSLDPFSRCLVVQRYDEKKSQSRKKTDWEQNWENWGKPVAKGSHGLTLDSSSISFTATTTCLCEYSSAVFRLWCHSSTLFGNWCT